MLSGRLKTDGVELLYEYLDNPDSAPDSPSSLAVVRDKQRVFREVVHEHLQTVTYSSEDMISSFYPAKFGGADVIVDPRINAGKPTFESAVVRVSDVIGRIEAGEPFEDVIDDFGIDEAVSRRVFATRPSRRIGALRAQNFSPRSLIWSAVCRRMETRESASLR